MMHDSTLETRPDMGYTIYYNPSTNDKIAKHDYDKSKIHLNDENLVYDTDQNLIAGGYYPIRPGSRNGKLPMWRWGFDTFIERLDEIVIREVNGGDSASFTQCGLNAPKNVLQFGSGTSEVKSLFHGQKLFDFPKGAKLISRLASIGSEKDSVILDFFAGSSTTAHAVMQLNAEDGGNRKFIMVQLPEACDEKSEAFKAGYPTIAEISKKRIRRAGKKIKEKIPQPLLIWIPDSGYLKSTPRIWQVCITRPTRLISPNCSRIQTTLRKIVRQKTCSSRSCWTGGWILPYPSPKKRSTIERYSLWMTMP